MKGKNNLLDSLCDVYRHEIQKKLIVTEYVSQRYHIQIQISRIKPKFRFQKMHYIGLPVFSV